MPLAEIARLEALADAEINEAKKVLATEATALAHGRDAAEAAAETARAVFESGRQPASGLPQVEVPREALERGMPAFELFARAGLAASNGEARRLIKGGGARINDSVVGGETQPVSLADLDPQGAAQAQRRAQAARAGAAGISGYCARRRFGCGAPSNPTSGANSWRRMPGASALSGLTATCGIARSGR